MKSELKFVDKLL